MDKKQVFNDWAPSEGYVWTKFAKPALFVHTENIFGGWVREANIPAEVLKLKYNHTAIIVDLPGVAGVEIGLGLTKAGFRPVPLYNGIHEPQSGGLRNIVDNTDIIKGLAAGARTLRNASLDTKAPPAFLLDANRDRQIPDTDNNEDIYDNRWNVDFDDMPDAAYMKEQGITGIIVWSDRDIQPDISDIVNDYLKAGIKLTTYINGQVTHIEGAVSSVGVTPQAATVQPEVEKAVRKFNHAKVALLIFAIIAGVNLISMMFFEPDPELGYGPLVYTAPSIMWLTYLWIPEIVGDVIAVMMTVGYFALYFLSKKTRSLVPTAAVILVADVVIFYIYVLWYTATVGDYTGGSFFYGLVAFVPPIILTYLLIRGVLAYKKIQEISDADYSAAVEHIRSYRGYGGYGGTGRGGYIGRGYRGGGFGG